MALVNPNNTLNWFRQASQLPLARQFSFLVGLAASISLGIGVIQWSQQSDMAPIYGELSLADSQDIIVQLQQSGTRYDLDASNGVLRVPASEVHQVRMQLASLGLPAGEGQGYEMLYQPQELGISSFMEKARYDRALEEELARSISSLQGVRTARVHLAIPESSGFLRDRGTPEASVLVGLIPGRSLSEQQISGIRYVVSSSVPELQVENVSVIDGQGRLLSNMAEAQDMIFGQDQFNVARELEQHYVDRIIALLTPLVGRDGVRAQVSAELDFTAIETTSESYSPESAVRSEQVVTERNTANAAGGVPGTLANQPPEDATLAAAPAGAGADALGLGVTSSSATRNFELDKTISHIREAPGSIQRMSVAVVVDYRETVDEAGEVIRTPLPAEELARIDALVRESVGFNEVRGDSLNIVNASFMEEVELEPLPELSLLEQPWFWQSLRLTVAAMVMLLLFFTVVRPLIKNGQLPSQGAQAQLAAPDAKGGAAGQNAAPEVAPVQAPDMRDSGVGEDLVTLTQGNSNSGALPVPLPQYQQQLAVARSLADEQPERVAQVVRNWVNKDG